MLHLQNVLDIFCKTFGLLNQILVKKDVTDIKFKDIKIHKLDMILFIL